MPGERLDPLARRLQRAIEKIEGVNSAGVVLNAAGEIAEIHVLASPSRRPKQIVRDIESLLFVQFGVRVDYRRISLVQPGSDVAASRKRLRFISAVPCDELGKTRVRVTLRCGDESYEESSVASPAGQGKPDTQAAAEATLRAVQRALGQAVQLTAHEAQLVSADGQQVCLVVVRALSPRGEERLTGTCLVADNVFEAAAKATLDAINRRLPVWATLPSPQTAKGTIDEPSRA